MITPVDLLRQIPWVFGHTTSKISPTPRPSNPLDAQKPTLL